MSEYSIPYASEDSLKETVIGYYRASSAGGEVSTERAADGADVSEDVVRRQRGFFNDISILTEGESGYALTEMGQEIGRALRHDRDDDAKSPFKELLLDWEATEKIIEDIGSDYVPKDDILDSIGFVTDHELDTHRQKAGANGLIGLYVWTGILETNSNDEYRATEIDPEAFESAPSKTPDDSVGVQSEEPDPVRPTQQPQGSEIKPQSTPNSTNSSFDISLELSGEEDPERIQNLVTAVRKGLEQDFEDDG